ncbi:MAG: sensor histidine kinase [Cytophagaceae bacterium]
MQIRSRLTFQFMAIVALLLLLFSSAIYYLSALHRYNDFEDRLKERALNTAKLLLEVDEIDESLLKTLRRKYLQTLPSEFVRVYSSDLDIVFKDDSLNYKIENEWLETILQEGEEGFEDGERQVIGMFYQDDLGDFIIVASAIDMYGHRKLKNLRIVLSVGFFIALIVIFFTGKIFANAALKPIQKVIQQVERITASNLHLRVDEGKGKDEISQLAITFNQMFQRIEEAFAMQKRFVSNASHELRTPLTTITGEISVALMKERGADEYKEVLKSVFDESKELTKLTNELLELAQTGMEENSVIMERIDPVDLFLRLCDEIYKRNPNCSLETNLLELSNTDMPPIFGNEKLLHTALINIVENAIKFSSNKPVRIKLVNTNNKELKFIIEDDGIGMTPSELKSIFQPFFRSENVSNIPGHGIGLPLCQRIVKIHGGRISVESSPGKGTVFVVTFPLSIVD